MTTLEPKPAFDPEQMLETAQLLLGIPDRRAEAEGLALRVLEEIPAGQWATRARCLLDEFDRRSASPRWRRDAELEKVRDAWAGLSGLDDGRLTGVWAQTASEPQRFAALRSEIELQLHSWIRALIRDVRRAAGQGEGDPQRHLAHFDALRATTAFQEHFEMALRESLEELHSARFELQLAKHKVEIQQALAQWQVDTARELLHALGEPPAGVVTHPLAEQHRQLDDVARQREAVEQLRAELEQLELPSDGSSLRRGLELLASGRGWLKEPMPLTIRDGLAAAIETTVSRVHRLVAQQVRSAVDLDVVRELGHSLEQLESRFQAAGVELEPSTFEPAAATLKRVWSKLLKAAEEPAAVTALAEEVMRDGALLPAPLVLLSQQWSRRLGTIADTWRTLRRGESFTPLPPEQIPPRCRNEQEEQQEIAQKLATASRLLETTAAGVKRAREIAEEILEKFPQHAQANQLAKVAECKEIARDLDSRLGGLEDGSFDLDAYCEIAGCEDAPQEHRALARQRELLTGLTHLFAHPPLGTTDAATAWWTHFSQLVRSVPELALPILERRLGEEGRARRAEWSLVLDRALAEQADTVAWLRVAAGLEEVAGDPRFDPVGELERYRIELTRRAELTRIAALLDAGSWERAQQALAVIDGDPERQRDLEVRLAVEGSFSRGDLSAFAAALARYWGRATQIYGAAATEKLLHGISTSWRTEQRATLAVLRDVAHRAHRVVPADTEAGRNLENWLAWLDLEEQTAQSLNVLSVTPLQSHLQALPPEVRCQRAERLIATWRSAQCSIALAWAFRALPDLRGQLFPDDVDPADSIAKQIGILIAEIHTWLTGPSPDDADPIAILATQAQSFQRRGKELKDQLRELGFLLDELPFTAARCVPDPALDCALQPVSSVITIAKLLAALAVADLRHESDRRDRCRTLIQELPRTAPWRSLLAAQLNRFEPLTRLVYDENRIKEAARRCADPEALDQPRVFTALAQALQVIADKLATADCSQAPVALAIAREYWQELPRMAGGNLICPDLSAAPTVPDLVAYFEALELNEQRFRETTQLLSQQEPPLAASGYVEPLRHRSYLTLVPAEAPASNRALELCKRFLCFGERSALFEHAAAAHLVPAWVSGVLQGGLP